MNSPIRWFGGKGILAPEILKHFPPEYTTYVEPYGGGASLLFAKDVKGVEVYNDKDEIVVNFFKVLREYPAMFHNQVHLMPYSREEYESAKEVLEKDKADSPLTDAVQFYIRARQCIGGDVFSGWSYGITKDVVHKWMNAIDKLPFIVERLRYVQVECLDGVECIKKYDTKETFFYVDPPYRHVARSSTRYRVDMKDWQHTELLKCLNEVEGMVLLSGYHNLMYDDKLKDWYYRNIETQDNATPNTRHTFKGNGSQRENQPRTEVLWWNEALEQAGHQTTIFEMLDKEK